MRTSMNKMKYGIYLFLAVLLSAQFVRMEKLNPPVRSNFNEDREVATILRRACYNCHSNETVWPWYSNVAPASWLVASDVSEGRRHLNFSDWESYDGDKKSFKMKAITEEITDRAMPPWYYSMVHRASRLSEDERARILSWAAKGHFLPEKQ